MRIVFALLIALCAQVFGWLGVALCQAVRSLAKRSAVAKMRGCSCAKVLKIAVSAGCAVVSPGCTSALPGTTLKADSPGCIQPTLQ